MFAEKKSAVIPCVLDNNLKHDKNLESNNSKSIFKIPVFSSIIQKLNFIKQHSIQPTTLKLSKGIAVVDFNKIYNRTVSGKTIYRNWLSILTNSNNSKSMFCSICIAFGTTKSNFTSDEGCTNFKHVYLALERHENFNVHCNSVENYFRASKKMSVDYLINRNLVLVKKKRDKKQYSCTKTSF